MKHLCDTEIAKIVGANAALVYQYIWFWIGVHTCNGTNFIDGRFWVYTTRRELKEVFEYLSEDEIRNALKKLIKHGLLVKGNYSTGIYARTSWYSTSEQIDEQSFRDSLVENPQRVWGNLTKGFGENPPNGLGKFHQTITNREYTNREINSDVVGGVRVHACARGGEPTEAEPLAESPLAEQGSFRHLSESEKQNWARAREQVAERFREEVFSSTIKRDQLKAANSIGDTEYFRFAEIILNEWCAADLPPSQWTWQHFVHTLRIKVAQSKKDKPQQSSVERRVAAGQEAMMRAALRTQEVLRKYGNSQCTEATDDSCYTK